MSAAGTQLRRMPRSSCSASSWPFFAGRSLLPASPGPIVASSPFSLVTYRASAGDHSSARRRRFSLVQLACEEARDLPRGRLGRLTLPDETVELIFRLASEKPRWGRLRTVGELKTVGGGLFGECLLVLDPSRVAESDARARRARRRTGPGHDGVAHLIRFFKWLSRDRPSRASRCRRPTTIPGDTPWTSAKARTADSERSPASTKAL